MARTRFVGPTEELNIWAMAIRTRTGQPYDFAYLRGRGHNLTRIPFRWERVQPKLNSPLKSAESSIA
jgi:hypothetical protein